MRLNSLLGLGGNGKAAQDPPSKRQKRSDVLDSLGLGAPSMKVTQSKPSRPASMLSMPGVPTPSMSSMSSMNSSKEPLTAAGACSPSSACRSASGSCLQCLAMPAADGLSSSNGDQVQRAQAQAWRSAFAEATNQWFVSGQRGAVFLPWYGEGPVLWMGSGRGVAFSILLWGRREGDGKSANLVCRMSWDACRGLAGVAYAAHRSK